MKDIDFDELDKAVNSLMSPSSSDTTSAEPSSTTPASPGPASSPAPQVSPAPTPTPSASTPPAVKKSPGRFMDVVHPSSDMRGSNAPLVPSRTPVSITPPKRNGPESTNEPKSATPTFDPGMVVPSEPVAPATPSFPDPLDVAQRSSSASEGASSVATPSDSAPTESLIAPPSETSEKEATEPLETLFLPNVKVEKRPLGMAAGADDSVEPAETETAPESTDSTDGKDTLVIPDPTLAELGDDVLAIESDKTSAEAPATDETEAPSTAMPEASAPAASPATFSSSIPRQYSVKASSDDKHHEALYDTAAQGSAPLQHPVAKKSGWMVIVWIVLLIVLGVGGALAVYFLNVF